MSTLIAAPIAASAVTVRWDPAPVMQMIDAEVERGRWAEQDHPGRMPRMILGNVWTTLSRPVQRTGPRDRTGYADLVSPEVALGWIAALLAAPRDGRSFRPLREMLTPVTTPSGRTAAEQIRRKWFALGERGPLAYAAGLSLVEASLCVRSGRLTAEDLTMLAALRNWQFPARP